MASRLPLLFLVVFATWGVAPVRAQQSEGVIDQARLRAQAMPPNEVTADGMATAGSEVTPEASDDDSLGAQRILKKQEKVRPFFVSGNASLVYTDNVALTRRGMRSDVFGIFDASAGWTPRLTKTLEANVGLRASVFRYDRTPELDFESLGAGAGITYAPSNPWGITGFARYDFTELLGSNGREILSDHSFTAGTQKTLVLGRSHALSFGTVGALGFSDPDAAQRHQLGAFVGYHLQVTRRIESDFLYRPAVYFYPDADRTDVNQVFSGSVRYRATDWAEFNATVGYGLNRSDRAVFDYGVLTTGVAAGLTVRF